MLTILTDVPDIAWLRYIWEEFRRMRAAAFEVRVLPAGTELPAGTAALSYAARGGEGAAVYRSVCPEPDGAVEYMDGGMYVIPGTVAADKREGGGYDMLWNAFVFLSRLEEYRAEEGGVCIRSYSARHPRTDKATFLAPVVDRIFDDLEALVKRYFPALPFGARPGAVIELTHDVDYIVKTLPLRGKQTAFNVFNAVRHPGRALPTLGKGLRFLFSSPSYWCFDRWAEWEKGMGRRSVFYVYARAGRRGPAAWLLDPSYDVRRDVRLKLRLRALLEDGFEVGLHGSFYSAEDGGLLTAEKAALEDALGRPVTRVRQHWLNYRETVTPYLHDGLFEHDSTLGWNDRPGFRSGTGYAYRPYDHRAQAAFGYTVIPQIAMDAHFYDYAADGGAVLRDARAMVREVAERPGVHCALSWHQRVCSADYGWDGALKDILAEQADTGGRPAERGKRETAA